MQYYIVDQVVITFSLGREIALHVVHDFFTEFITDN